MGFVTLEIELWPVLWFGVTCVGCFCMWDDFRGRPVADASFLSIEISALQSLFVFPELLFTIIVVKC